MMALVAAWIGEVGCQDEIRPSVAYDDAAVPDAGSSDGSVDDAGFASDPSADGAIHPGWEGCGPCVPNGPCVAAYCDEEARACAETPVDDGVACGSDGVLDSICVAGECVARGCGDGYREPGPEPAREGCDDGNVRDGDLCSSSCKAEVHLIDADDANDYDALAPLPGPAVGVDGEGRYLVVWLQDHYGSEKLVARRFDAMLAPRGELVGGDADAGTGEFEPELLVLDDALGTPSNAHPVVAGLAGGGWVVAWAVTRFGSREIAYRMVSASGELGSVRIANQQQLDLQSAPQAIAWGDGFLLGWSSTYQAPSVLMRAFHANGSSAGSEFAPAGTRVGSESELRLVRSGATYLALWVNQGVNGDPTPILRGRRFDEDGPIDATPIDLTTEAATSPAVAGLGDGGFAFAWRTATNDLQGDVKMRVLAPGLPVSLGAVEDVAVEPGYEEEHPAIAALPGGGLAVLWDDDFPPQPTFALTEDATPGSEELAWLELWVSVHAESNLSALLTPRGVLFLWEGTSPIHYGGALSAFLLPFD